MSIRAFGSRWRYRCVAKFLDDWRPKSDFIYSMTNPVETAGSREWAGEAHDDSTVGNNMRLPARLAHYFVAPDREQWVSALFQNCRSIHQQRLMRKGRRGWQPEPRIPFRPPWNQSCVDLHWWEKQLCSEDKRSGRSVQSDEFQLAMEDICAIMHIPER